MFEKASRFALTISLVTALAACSQQPARPEIAPGSLAWPPPPLQARIVYLHEIRTPEDFGVGTGFLQSLSRAIIGSEERDIGQPYGLAVARDGELLVVDNAYNAVHRLDPQDGKYSRIPRKPMAGFRNPVNVALGSDDRVFISDSVSGLVHVFTNRGDRYLRSIGEGILQRPTGLAVNPLTNELLIIDTKLSQIAVFDETTLAFKRSIGNQNSGSMNTPSFHYPTNISVSSEGTVYVADSLNFRVQVLDSALNPVTEFGKAGNAPGNFSRPKGLATDSDGHVYVIDAIFDNIQVFAPDGSLMIAFGRPGKNAGEFWMPNAICIDDQDRIYVSDAFNQRIQVFQYVKAGSGH